MKFNPYDVLGVSKTATEDEIKSAVSAGAYMIGVNSRNLKNFEVDLEIAKRLRDAVPADKLFVAESGISSIDDVRAFSKTGADI